MKRQKDEGADSSRRRPGTPGPVGTSRHVAPPGGQIGLAKGPPQELRAGRWFGLFAAILLAATLFAYLPAWEGGLVWDDEAHITKPELRSLRGLGRIWFDLDATQQYYPLLHSAFWLQWQLWGDSTLGYHLVNIVLHGIAAGMFAMILRRLGIPGAYLAAAIFALHPVHVESVAWITELKNTLSGVFYLGAALAYLRFDQTRRKGAYALALALFVMGLLSKTVVATLPAALLVVFWWKRGRLSWKRDVRPLVPLFVIGACAGLGTAWVERNIIGAKGEEFAFTIIERCLIAGRVVWFYLGKLSWPANLTFIYPRWQVSQDVWWQYLFPAAAIVMLAALWAIRRRLRAPLAAMLFFVGTLFPVLGFFNVYPFKFSLVANHFQYLPSLGIITLAAAGIAYLLKRLKAWQRIVGYAACVALVAILATLTWRQSTLYENVATLFEDTLAKNEECWMGHVVLGVAREKQDKEDEAIDLYRKALRLRPTCVEAHINLGRIFAARGELQKALEHDNRALEIEPGAVMARNQLAYVLTKQGKLDEAIEQYRQVLRGKPDLAEAHFNLGSALAAKGRIAQALEHYREALRLAPYDPDTQQGLDVALAAMRKLDAAIDHYREMLWRTPEDPKARCDLARALVAKNLIDRAVGQYRRALAIDPNYPEACNNLAWLLATHASLAGSDPAEALALAQRAYKAIGDARPDLPDTLAAAYANQGIFAEAVETAQRAIKLAEAAGQTQLTEEIKARLGLYRDGKPFRWQ